MRAIKGLCGSTNITPKLIVVSVIVDWKNFLNEWTMSLRQLHKQTGKRQLKALLYFPEENKTGIVPPANQ